MPIPKKKSEKEKDYLKKTYLWFGQPKVGKTTTAANFGNAENGGQDIMFFATEAGHKFVEVFKWQTDDGTDPMRWEHWQQCCRELAKDPGDFKCIAIDTIDNLWAWCSEYVLYKKQIDHESDEGFGKGYAAVSKEFSKPLDYLLKKKFGIIFLSHAKDSEKQIGPRKVNFTDSTLPNTAKKLIHGLCDYIFYFGAEHDGTRYIQTQYTENVNAGDRSGEFPEKVEMSAEILKEFLIDRPDD